jgi:large subunit ribosomal protein L1
MVLLRLPTCSAERIVNPLWICNHAFAKRKNQAQQQTIRTLYPNYYETPEIHRKVKYTIDSAVDLLREQCANNPNSMVSVGLNMNLDYRVKAHRISGVFDFPHAIGKLRSVAVVTPDAELADAALNAGANYAGDLEPQIMRKQIKFPQSFDVLIATTDMTHNVTGRSTFAGRLKQYKIVPCVELKTICEPEELCEVVRKYSYGFMNQYANDTNGNVSTSIGKFSLDTSQIVDNFHQVLRHLFKTQLDKFGNGPDAKEKNIGKYILGIHVHASQGESCTLDLDSIEILRELNQKSIPVTKNWKMKKIKN